MVRLRHIRLALISVAVILCLLEACWHWLGLLVFTEHESARMWAVVFLPSVLWLPAVVAARYPWRCVAVLAALVLVALLLCSGPQQGIAGGWAAAPLLCISDFRLSLAALALLVANAILARRSKRLSRQSRLAVTTHITAP